MDDRKAKISILPAWRFKSLDLVSPRGQSLRVGQVLIYLVWVSSQSRSASPHVTVGSLQRDVAMYLLCSAQSSNLNLVPAHKDCFKEIIMKLTNSESFAMSHVGKAIPMRTIFDSELSFDESFDTAIGTTTDWFRACEWSFAGRSGEIQSD